tara:strand:- start:552 stop:731 length:180 start_codon:yes stop_codon:yes gene_type:complete
MYYAAFTVLVVKHCDEFKIEMKSFIFLNTKKWISYNDYLFPMKYVEKYSYLRVKLHTLD